MQFLGVTVLICLFQLFGYSFACDGYNVKLISIENGPNNPTLVLQDDPQIFLTKDCKLRLKGHLDILKPVSCAELSFKAKRNGILTVLDANDVDLCELLASSEYPYECPLDEGEYTADFGSALDVSEYKKYLAKVVGSITVDAQIVTNHKEVNTFCLELEITRKTI